MTDPRITATETAERRRAVRVVSLSRWLCLAGGTLGALGLLGWISRSAILYTLVPGQPPMMPNTAVGLTLAGIIGVILGWRRSLSQVRVLVGGVAIVLLVVGLGTESEYVFGIDLGIDTLLNSGAGGPYPGRPSPLTAIALALIGFALLLFDSYPSAQTRPSEWLLVSATLIGLVGLTGQILGTASVYQLPQSPVIGMAVPTAVSLILSSGGMLLSRPYGGIVAVAISDGPGGVLLRFVAAPSVIVPMVLGFGINRLLQILDMDEFPIVVAMVAVAITAAALAILVITARHLNRRHAELETNRARTRDIVELASDGIFMADLDGRYTDVNEAGCRMLGMTPGEIVGKTIIDLIPPEEVDRLAASRTQMLEGGSHIGEWHLRHKSGAYVPVEVNARILPYGRWQGIVRDISERKAAEEAIRAAQARVEGIISIAADAIIAVDESQRITMFNRGAEQIFGWSTREAIGRPLDMLIPERFRALHRAHVRAFADEPVAARRVNDRPAPIYGLRKDGTEFTAEAAISKLRIDNELTFTVVLRDVTTERRRAEQDRLLAEIGLLMTSSLERKQMVKQAAQVLVREFADACVIDLVDPDADDAVTRLAVVHRDSRKHDTARALEHIVLDRSRPHLASASIATRRTKIITHVTPELLDSMTQSQEHRRLVEEFAPVSAITVPLLAHGYLLGVLSFVSSNEQRRYDQKDAPFVEEIAQRLALALDNARHFATAANAVKARDEVLRIVVHDLRNPLGTILMGASLLQEPGDGNGGRRKSAATIETAAKRMNRLIRDLLDVSRSEAGRLSVEHAPVAADRVVRDAVAAQQALAAKASLELQAELPDNLPKVYGDWDRLLQIFENLIGNAIKFTPAGGRIVVAAASRDQEVLFSVRDTGAGIAAEDLPHVFDRFWQGRRQRSKGAGLGLPIVKGLVTAHGGRIWAESTLGHGSTFHFTIPVARQPAGSS